MQSITCGQLLHIATYAAWSAGPCVCLSVGHNSPVLKRLNRSRCPLECGLTTQVGPRNRVSGGTIPLKRGQFGGWHLSLSCKKISGNIRHAAISQLCSVGGNSAASFRWQYCSSLLAVFPAHAVNISYVYSRNCCLRRLITEGPYDSTRSQLKSCQLLYNCTNKYQLLQMDPRDALPHSHRAVRTAQRRRLNVDRRQYCQLSSSDNSRATLSH